MCTTCACPSPGQCIDVGLLIGALGALVVGAGIIRSKASWQLSGWAAVTGAALMTLSDLASPTVLTNALRQAYTVAWLVIVTAFTRTVSTQTMGAFYALGAYPALLMALLLGQPMAAWIGMQSDFIPALWVPVTEEAVKAAPVAVYFAVASNRWRPSASDGALLGFLVGAGFDLHENLIYDRPAGTGWGQSWWSMLFPTVSYGRGGYYGGSHDIVTALVGLAIGLAFVLRARRYVWLVPVVVFTFVVFRHGTENTRQATASVIGRVVTLNGRLLLIALLVGTIVAIALDARRRVARDTAVPGSRAR